MPGDEAIITIDLQSSAAQTNAAQTSAAQNGAIASGPAGGTGSAGNSAPGTQKTSTPIERTTLKGSDEIEVITPDYSDLGMIGPKDRITIYYKIKAKENISSGTYLIDFTVVGGPEIATISRQIPVKVDPATVSIAQADVSTASGISLNVANPRENTLNAMIIIPSAPGIIFSPDRYYIGTMNPDEVFTISFKLSSKAPGSTIEGPANLTFNSEFKNGENWHKSGPYTVSYAPPVDDSEQKSSLLPAGAALIILLALGFYVYRKKRTRSSPRENDRKSA